MIPQDQKKTPQTKDSARVTPNYQHWLDWVRPPQVLMRKKKNGDRNVKIKALLFIYNTRGGFWLVREKKRVDDGDGNTFAQ